MQKYIRSEDGKVMFFVPLETLEEIDRNARAYGWEIGKGQTIGEPELDTTDGNPFEDPNWRKTHGLNAASEGRDIPAG